MELLKKVHALGSYLFRGKHVGMCVCVKVALTNSPMFSAMEAVRSDGVYRLVC